MPKLKIEEIVLCPRQERLFCIVDCEKECWFFNKRWGKHLFCNYGLTSVFNEDSEDVADCDE